MNMQNLMREAQKMQAELAKTQKELETTNYEGTSSLVNVMVNGKKDLLKLEILDKENFDLEDLEMLEDMVIVAIQDAFKKADKDKESKLSKYQGLSGLL